MNEWMNAHFTMATRMHASHRDQAGW